MSRPVVLAGGEIRSDRRTDLHRCLQAPERLDAVKSALRHIEAQFLRLVAAKIEKDRMSLSGVKRRASGRGLARRGSGLFFFIRGRGYMDERERALLAARRDRRRDDGNIILRRLGAQAQRNIGALAVFDDDLAVFWRAQGDFDFLIGALPEGQGFIGEIGGQGDNARTDQKLRRHIADDVIGAGGLQLLLTEGDRHSFRRGRWRGRRDAGRSEREVDDARRVALRLQDKRVEARLQIVARGVLAVGARRLRAKGWRLWRQGRSPLFQTAASCGHAD